MKPEPEPRSCFSSIVMEPGNRWIQCRMGVSLLVSDTNHPILIRKGMTVTPELAMHLAEWSYGRWLKYDGRWGELGAFQARAVVLAKTCQPDMRITYVRPRTGLADVLDTMHNDGSITLVDEPETQKDCWLVATDSDAETDLLYTWTHQEWDLLADQPGAWTRSNGIWRYRKHVHPKNVAGKIAVTPVEAMIAATR